MGEKNNFQVLSAFETNENQKVIKPKIGFVKGILIPFISGILGCSLVIGLCYYNPYLKEKIIGKQETVATTVQTSGNISKDNDGTVKQVSLSSYSDTAVYAANKILPSIVGIEIEYEVTSNFSIFGGVQKSTAKATGSGIIISEDGYILTNNHVVDSSANSSSYSYYSLSEAKSVKVSLYGDKTIYDATIVGKDSQTDLAVLKIDKTGLTAAEFADSDKIKIGEFAMAVGNPLGLQTSITCGVISAVNREVTSSDGTVYKCIQTDAAINSGNSGGALVNSEGKVIGVNTLKLSGTGIEGIGFAIPINSTVDITKSLIENKKVIRPYIGLELIELDEELAKENDLPVGLYVKKIAKESKASDAGLKVADVIIKADGKEVKTVDELNEIRDNYKIGDKIKLTVSRDGILRTIEVEIVEQP